MTGLGFMLNRRGAKEEARVWWQRAAEAGDVTAMDNLASVLSRPEGERWRWHAAAARRDPRTEEVPSEVASAAVTAGLGGHQSTFGWDSKVHLRVFPLAAALPVIGLLLSLQDADSPDGPAPGWIIGGLITAVAFALPFGVLQRRAKKDDVAKVWRFEHGFVYRHRGGKLEGVPWTVDRDQGPA